MTDVCLLIDHMTYTLRRLHHCKNWAHRDHSKCKVIATEGRKICACPCHDDNDRTKAMYVTFVENSAFKTKINQIVKRTEKLDNPTLERLIRLVRLNGGFVQ